MRSMELELCQIQEWYPRFRSVSLKTLIHELPETYVSYLQQDGIFLPADSQALPARRRSELDPAVEIDEDYKRWQEDEDDTEEPDAPSFPELEAQVTSSIEKLGGHVFPKLNWSAPKDSAWISPSSSLRCSNFSEISLLLKASDSLVHDLCHAFDSCEDPPASRRPASFYLALRKWYDLRPEMEFRAFVRNGILVGISQREVTGFYPSLLESSESIQTKMFQFFVENICEAFELDDYTFDCYVTRSGTVKLIDFNPWGAFTLPLLFTWEELSEVYAKFSQLLLTIEGSNEIRNCKNSPGNSSNEIVNSGNTDTAIVEGNAYSGNNLHMEHNADVNDSSLYQLKNSVSPINDDVPSTVVHDDGYQSKCSSNGATDDGKVYENGSKSYPKRRKSQNLALHEHGAKAEIRVIENDCHVQPNLRTGGGVPYDYIQTGPGSPWDEFLQRASQELHVQNEDLAAGG